MAKLKAPPTVAGPVASAENSRLAQWRREVGGPKDPRWAIMPHARLTPAMRFLLMTGAHTEARLKGWVALAQAGHFDEPIPEAVWAAHQDTLIAEAAACGFQPFALHKKPPRGAGFDAWRSNFLKEHAY